MRWVEERVRITGEQLGEGNEGEMLVRLAIDRTDHGRGLSRAIELAFHERHVAILHGRAERFEVGSVTHSEWHAGPTFQKSAAAED